MTASFGLTLDGSSTESCTNITIVDDDILEDSESFTVSITEDDSRVDVDRNQATIEIMDNDGRVQSIGRELLAHYVCSVHAPLEHAHYTASD